MGNSTVNVVGSLSRDILSFSICFFVFLFIVFLFFVFCFCFCFPRKLVFVLYFPFCFALRLKGKFIEGKIQDQKTTVRCVEKIKARLQINKNT